jgi:hypothetical protein
VCTSMPEAHTNMPGAISLRSACDHQGNLVPGTKRQATSDKLFKATGRRPATNCRASIWRIDMRFKLQAASNKRQVCKSAHPLEWCIFLLKGKSFSYRVLYITNRRRKYESRCRKSKTSKRLYLESLGRGQNHEREEENSSYLWSRNVPNGIRNGSKRNDQEGGERWTIEACSSLENKSRKLLWSTIRRIVLSGPLRLSLCWSAAGITGAWRRWTKQNLGKLSSISPNSTVRTPHNVEKNLDFNYNCSPGESWGCGILPRVTMSQEKAESCKRQAASHKQQASSRVGSKAFGGEKGCVILSRVTMSQRLKVQAASFKPQAASIKLQATSC